MRRIAVLYEGVQGYNLRLLRPLSPRTPACPALTPS